MTSAEIRKTFLNFFKERDHLEIPQASLVPEYDPTLLFTNSGMAPLKPYFLGAKEPPSERLCNIQRCLRTEDLDSVGNLYHHTLFEMLGSWSIKGYGKRQAVEFAFDLLTSKEEGFNLDPSRLYATVFSGDEHIPKDEKTARYWREAGLKEDQILFLPAKDNLWVSGPEGPCGPCTEVLYDRGKEFACGPNCSPTCGCGRFYEIWNAGVFMEYNKKGEGKFEKLPFLSVDTGAGLERLAAVLQKTKSNYETDLFWPIIQAIETVAEVPYGEDEDHLPHFRIIADHTRAATFLIVDGVSPSNVERGYVLRKLIRRAIESGLALEIHGYFLSQLAKKVVDLYGENYPHLRERTREVYAALENEEKLFGETIRKGLAKLERMGKNIDAFMLFDTYGLPLSITRSVAKKKGIKINEAEFRRKLKAQKERAREAREVKPYNPEEIKTAHTGAHLLNAALRAVLGSSVYQAGQKISPRRIRHDFTFDRPLDSEELQKVEDLVNEKIRENLTVEHLETTYKRAKQEGAEALFEDKYRALGKVTLFRIGDFSKELCGGPHASSTGELGSLKIERQTSVGRGVRRVYARVSR